MEKLSTEQIVDMVKELNEIRELMKSISGKMDEIIKK